jgi:hypothetical protein
VTREEILEKIKFKGEYTIEVKKQLKKLLKKYHPDTNKKDKTTILLLYDIKKELENGTLKYTPKTSHKRNNKKTNNINSNRKISFFESIIENLKRKEMKLIIKLIIYIKDLMKE